MIMQPTLADLGNIIVRVHDAHQVPLASLPPESQNEGKAIQPQHMSAWAARQAADQELH
jgi:hypothetical protein